MAFPDLLFVLPLYVFYLNIYLGTPSQPVLHQRHQQQRCACWPGAVVLEAFAVGIPRADCKAHCDKKCLLRKVWDNAKLDRVVTIEGGS